MCDVTLHNEGMDGYTLDCWPADEWYDDDIYYDDWEDEECEPQCWANDSSYEADCEGWGMGEDECLEMYDDDAAPMCHWNACDDWETDWDMDWEDEWDYDWDMEYFSTCDNDGFLDMYGDGCWWYDDYGCDSADSYINDNGNSAWDCCDVCE